MLRAHLGFYSSEDSMREGCSYWIVDFGGAETLGSSAQRPPDCVVLGHLDVRDTGVFSPETTGLCSPWPSGCTLESNLPLLMLRGASDFASVSPAVLAIMHFSKTKRDCELFL